MRGEQPVESGASGSGYSDCMSYAADLSTGCKMVLNTSQEVKVLIEGREAMALARERVLVVREVT